MSCLFMAVHHPEPGRRDDVYASLQRMAESMAGTPGLSEIGPWLEYDGDAVAGATQTCASRRSSGRGTRAGSAASASSRAYRLLRPERVPMKRRSCRTAGSPRCAGCF